MKTIFNHLEAEDLMYALFEHGGDPMIIEDEETAKFIADIINAAEDRGEIEDDGNIDPEFGEFAIAKRQLNIDESIDVKRIYWFCNGSYGKICLFADYE